MDVIPSVMQVTPEKVVLKERKRQRGTQQYTRKAQREEWMEIDESPVRLLVNLHDYLDTGVFLDHRLVRQYIGEHSKGKRFLNLFCYTGAASVHAGVGGARYSTSVDMSQTYLGWAQRNLALNGLSDSRHRTERADCLKWLENRAKFKDESEKFDLILLDPPTFSNSKKMDETLDIQRDHAGIVDLAMACLAEDGQLIFSNNRRGFNLDESVADNYYVQDKTRWSIPEDFSRRSQLIHHCYFISHKTDAQIAAENEKARAAASAEIEAVTGTEPEA
jgi:23S rRNA (guanine2445-N2)-methyltransferase / 23S rRNA (guanine2069-N7)-methyltransferase